MPRQGEGKGYRSPKERQNNFPMIATKSFTKEFTEYQGL
jgi:hypothetical protein